LLKWFRRESSLKPRQRYLMRLSELLAKREKRGRDCCRLTDVGSAYDAAQ